MLAFGALLYSAERGYPWLTTALAPFLGWLCWSLRRAPWQGAELSWRQGEWQLLAGGQPHRVELLPGAVALPWVALVPLRCTASHTRCNVWIFVDSVARGQWRQLRVRLRLSGPGRADR